MGSWQPARKNRERGGGKTAAKAEAAAHANWQKTKHAEGGLPLIAKSPKIQPFLTFCWPAGRGPVFAKDLAQTKTPFWQSASSSSCSCSLAFHVCQTELWLVNIFVHSGRKKDCHLPYQTTKII